MTSENKTKQNQPIIQTMGTDKKSQIILFYIHSIERKKYLHNYWDELYAVRTMFTEYWKKRQTKTGKYNRNNFVCKHTKQNK